MILFDLASQFWWSDGMPFDPEGRIAIFVCLQCSRVMRRYFRILGAYFGGFYAWIYCFCSVWIASYFPRLRSQQYLHCLSVASVNEGQCQWHQNNKTLNQFKHEYVLTQSGLNFSPVIGSSAQSMRYSRGRSSMIALILYTEPEDLQELSAGLADAAS